VGGERAQRADERAYRLFKRRLLSLSPRPTRDPKLSAALKISTETPGFSRIVFHSPETPFGKRFTLLRAAEHRIARMAAPFRTFCVKSTNPFTAT
jgi:hypothetical protein